MSCLPALDEFGLLECATIGMLTVCSFTKELMPPSVLVMRTFFHDQRNNLDTPNDKVVARGMSKIVIGAER